MGRKKEYSDEEILGALRAFYEKHGRAPYKREQRGMQCGVPSSSTLAQRFGSAPRAFRLAGVPTNSPGSWNNAPRIELPPIDPVKAEALTREKQAWWSRTERSDVPPKHGLLTWTHPYARRAG
jgi:hypothetical protein